MKSWVVATTRPSCERRALFALKEHGFEAYCPMVGTPYRGRVIQRPLIYSYVFYRFTPRWREVRSTDWLREYVKRILVCGDEPIPVEPERIEALRTIESEELGKAPPRKFKVGDLVRVLEGAFEGFVGSVTHVRTKRRICVELDLFGRKSYVQLKEEAALAA